MVLRSPVSDIEIPEQPLSAFIFADAHTRADKPALIDGPSGRTITYGELNHAVRSLAGGLATRGFAPGEIFGIFSPNSPEYAVAFHGIVAAGGTVTTINPLSTVEELRRQLDLSRPRYLLTVPPLVATATAAAEQTGVEQVFVFGEAAGVSSFDELMGDPDKAPELDIDTHEQIVTLPYSSGTTGLPKGVMLTHHNLIANVLQADALLDISSDDVAIGVLPFFHIYGLTIILNMALRYGATVVTMPRFDLEEFLQLHQDHRITRSYVAPPLVLALAKHPIIDNYDLSALEVVVSGAAPLSAELQEAAAARLQCSVVQGYGLTETSPATHVGPRDRNKPGTIGVLVPNTEAKIIDLDSGAEVPTGERGELCIRGPQVMKGYLHDPDATSAMIDTEGWLHTGDIGIVDDEGYFKVVDRVKELIKYKGYAVAPAELEAVLLEHPQIADVAVIGRADEEAGEIPVAYVVAEGLDADAVLGFVSERVAPYKRVRAVRFTEQIPKSPSGKILRRVLIDAER